MNTTNITNATVSNLTCLYLDPNAAQAKRGFDVWMYIAYSCLVFSYININILVFRFWLVLSAIFFIVWGCDPVRTLQLDTLLFNLLFIIINIVQSIPLVKQVWPVTLTPLEVEIYERDFKSSMDKRQFKRLISKMETLSFDAHNSQLCVIKSRFNYLIYVAKLNPGWKIVLRKDDTNVITELSEGSWIGTIEYMFELQRKEGDAPIKWGITASVEESKECLQTNPNYLPTVSEGRLIPNLDDAGCLIYVFDCQKLKELYNDSIYPMFYKNALQAAWLNYTTEYIKKQDINLIDNYDDDEEELFDNGDNVSVSKKSKKNINTVNSIN